MDFNIRRTKLYSPISPCTKCNFRGNKDLNIRLVSLAAWRDGSELRACAEHLGLMPSIHVVALNSLTPDLHGYQDTHKVHIHT